MMGNKTLEHPRKINHHTENMPVVPELILERSHFLIQSWCTNCRLPVHLQGSMRGFELDCSPIWQILHRSPSSSSESSNSRLDSRKRVWLTSANEMFNISSQNTLTSPESSAVSPGLWKRRASLSPAHHSDSSPPLPHQPLHSQAFGRVGWTSPCQSRGSAQSDGRSPAEVTQNDPRLRRMVMPRRPQITILHRRRLHDPHPGLGFYARPRR